MIIDMIRYIHERALVYYYCYYTRASHADIFSDDFALESPPRGIFPATPAALLLTTRASIERFGVVGRRPASADRLWPTQYELAHGWLARHRHGTPALIDPPRHGIPPLIDHRRLRGLRLLASRRRWRGGVRWGVRWGFRWGNGVHAGLPHKRLWLPIQVAIQVLLCTRGQ